MLNLGGPANYLGLGRHVAGIQEEVRRADADDPGPNPAILDQSRRGILRAVKIVQTDGPGPSASQINRAIRKRR